MLLDALRKARHGPLRRFGGAWLVLGRLHRAVVDRTGVTAPVRMRIGPYGPFRLHQRFAFSDFEHWGTAQNEGFEACVERCRGASCVLDVGAHIGLVTLPVSSVLASGGRVFSFEPAEANLAVLRHHVEANGITNVEVVSSLVGATDVEEVEFFEMDEPTGMNSVVVKKQHERYHATRRPQVTIDRFCAERGLHPEVVKIDVEGAELDVLDGARATLVADRPVLFLSVHPTQLGMLGHDVDELAGLLAELHYVVRTIGGEPVDELHFAEYLVVPKEAA